jgi:epoxyqueuosine reductase
VLVHICCSVDSHYFLEKIKEEYPQESIVGYFYDPNIHPYSEYALRLLDVKFSCKKLGIELIEGPYNLENWLHAVKGLENEPEKGDRCTVCFDERLKNSALKAKELGHTRFTTTLLISPKKSQDKLEIIGNVLAKEHNLEFIFKDYRVGNGTQLQGEAVKSNALYRQNYCGCLFGLMPQREQQNKLLDEMMLPLNQQILPQSIEERYALYTQRNQLEHNNIPFLLVKTHFLNYRLLRGWVQINKHVVPSHILCYSTLNKEKTSGKVEYVHQELHYLNKEDVKLLKISLLNTLCHTNYSRVLELLKHPLTFEEEINLRHKLTQNAYDLSTILVLDSIPCEAKFDIHIQATVFEDVKETILLKGAV